MPVTRGPPQGDAAPAVHMGTYRAVLPLPGGELPFGLELAANGTKTVGYLLNGKERVPLNEVTLSGAHLEIRMPGYENRLTADTNGDQLMGEVVLSKPGGKQQHIALHAQRGQEFRFFEKALADNVDLSGRWAVKFTDDDGKPELAVGEFAQSHDVITGTFLAQTGDHRYLAGQVQGDELYLSTFDGAHAFLYKAKVEADGTLTGDFWVGTAFHEHFTGKTVGSKDPEFKDKVMIVALAGSGCPNCHDDAAKKLPMLDRVYAFPTTIFVDRKGKVRKIHTGFSGPATGDHYTQFVAEVKATLDQLLAET